MQTVVTDLSKTMSSENSKRDLTVDEILSLLKHTTLPTVVVEGRDDMIVYRAFEHKLAHIGVSFLSAGGRINVLEIFRRRLEISNNRNVGFIADKDIWVNTGVPKQYQDKKLIFTSGYSIENDIYIDGELWKLLDSDGETNFGSDLNNFTKWYALALSRHLVDPSKEISFHPNHVLDSSEREALLELNYGEIYPTALHETIFTSYATVLRGKSLIALLIRNTNKHFRHSDKALLHTVAVRPGQLLNAISSNIEAIMK
jgi:hypothetical protein